MKILADSRDILGSGTPSSGHCLLPHEKHPETSPFIWEKTLEGNTPSTGLKLSLAKAALAIKPRISQLSPFKPAQAPQVPDFGCSEGVEDFFWHIPLGQAHTSSVRVISQGRIALCAAFQQAQLCSWPRVKGWVCPPEQEKKGPEHDKRVLSREKES